jgi:hypothetical protein
MALEKYCTASLKLGSSSFGVDLVIIDQIHSKRRRGSSVESKISRAAYEAERATYLAETAAVDGALGLEHAPTTMIDTSGGVDYFTDDPFYADSGVTGAPKMHRNGGLKMQLFHAS